MKKALIVFLSVFILAFTSCSLINNNLTTSFSIDLDTALAEKINNSSRAMARAESNDFTVVITLKGATNQKKTVKMEWMDLEPYKEGPEKHNSVTFDNIPLNAPFDIYVDVYADGELYYSASKKNVVLSKTGTTNLTMILKELLNTQYVLYREKEGEPGLGCFLSISTIDDLRDRDWNLIEDTAPSFSDFCFNANGDVIYLPSSGASQPSAEESSFTEDASLYSVFICCDMTDNSIYSVGDRSDGGMSFTKFIYNKDNPDCYYDSFISGGVRVRSLPGEPDPFEYASDSDTHAAVAAYNGSLFLGFNKNRESPDQNASFLILKFNLTPYSAEYIDSSYAGTAEIILDAKSNNYTITDMICLDGYCYVLIKDSNSLGLNDKNLTVSRGLIAKINCDTLAVKTSGLASVKTTPEGTRKSAWIYPGFFNAFICTDSNASHYYTAEMTMNSEYVYAGPSTKEKDSCFFGPDRFIAIKPKKLVVSDTGTYIWTNRDGVFAKKNINRVVYVDLDTLAISDTVDINPKAVEFSTSYPVAQYDTTESVSFDLDNYWYYYISSSGADQHSIITETINIIPGFAID